MKTSEIKTEILQFVETLETNYNETIRELKAVADRERLKSKRAHFDKVNDVSAKGELEMLFVECIEEIRKDIMKRRLKNEITSKKKF